MRELWQSSFGPLCQITRLVVHRVKDGLTLEARPISGKGSWKRGGEEKRRTFGSALQNSHEPLLKTECFIPSLRDRRQIVLSVKTAGRWSLFYVVRPFVKKKSSAGCWTINGCWQYVDLFFYFRKLSVVETSIVNVRVGEDIQRKRYRLYIFCLWSCCGWNPSHQPACYVDGVALNIVLGTGSPCFLFLRFRLFSFSFFLLFAAALVFVASFSFTILIYPSVSSVFFFFSSHFSHLFCFSSPFLFYSWYLIFFLSIRFFALFCYCCTLFPSFLSVVLLPDSPCSLLSIAVFHSFFSPAISPILFILECVHVVDSDCG